MKTILSAQTQLVTQEKIPNSQEPYFKYHGKTKFYAQSFKLIHVSYDSYSEFNFKLTGRFRIFGWCHDKCVYWKICYLLPDKNIITVQAPQLIFDVASWDCADKIVFINILASPCTIYCEVHASRSKNFRPIGIWHLKTFPCKAHIINPLFFTIALSAFACGSVMRD